MSKEHKKIKAEIMKEHLPYELNMLEWTHLALQSECYGSTWLKLVMTNTLIESFCIHARSLLDFFGNKQGVPANDFTKKSTYQPSFIRSIRKATKTKLNTQLAHLTYKRTSDASRKISSQDRNELLDAIFSEAEAFKKKLKPTYRELFSWNRPKAEEIQLSSVPGTSSTFTTTVMRQGMSLKPEVKFKLTKE